MIGGEGSVLSFRLIVPTAWLEPSSFGKGNPGHGQFSVAFGSLTLEPRVDFTREDDVRTNVMLSITAPSISPSNATNANVPISVQIRPAHSKMWSSFEAGTFHYGGSRFF